MDSNVITTITTALVSAAGALGGWESIKYVLNRKTNQRKEEAETDLTEFHVLAETNHTLQEIYQSQTQRLRDTQDELMQLMREKASIELELQKYKCVRPLCAQREPQNGY